MRNEIQEKVLKGIRVLDITSGPSGAYAIRLLAQSGAFIQRAFRGPKSTLKSEDNKEMLALREFGKLLEESWSLIVWDSHCDTELDQTIWSYFNRKYPNNIGVRINFPAGISLEEEEDLQAFGGWMELTGDPEKEPLKVGGHPASCLIGAHTATGGLLALIEKKNGGCGRLVEISVPTILASALEGVYANYANSGSARTRKGNRHNKLTPMAILPVSDGWGFVGAPVDEQWALLERWAGLPHYPDWANAEDRYAQQENVEAALAGWTQNMAREDLFLTGQAFRLPFASVQSLEDVRNCPHLKIRGFWSEDGMKLPWKINENERVSRSATKAKPLKDLRILDLTSMWSGPYCTRIFGDLGAKVIKIEAPHRPDGIRPSEGVSSSFFCELNRNKLGVSLNLQLDEEKKHFLKLVETSDVLIENFSPRVMGNLGLADEKLWEINPGLLIVSLSAFGQSGPYRDFIGYGPTIESMSGISYMTRYEDGEPWLPGFSVSDLGAGIHGAFALASALIYRHEKGSGIKVDVSQYEVACQFVENAMFAGKRKPRQADSRAARDIVSFIEKEEVNILSMDDGTVTLGAPWSSNGWTPESNRPPELGQHQGLILQSVYRSNNLEKEALLNEI